MGNSPTPPGSVASWNAVGCATDAYEAARFCTLTRARGFRTSDGHSRLELSTSVPS